MELRPSWTTLTILLLSFVYAPREIKLPAIMAVSISPRRKRERTKRLKKKERMKEKREKEEERNKNEKEEKKYERKEAKRRLYLTPSQGLGALVGEKRLLPTGGVAYGIPRYTSIGLRNLAYSKDLVTPCTSP